MVLRKSIFITLLLCFFATSSMAKMISVNRETVNLRSGPGEKYEIKYQYGKGFPLQVISTKGSWYKVKDFENDTGWVFKSLLDTTPHTVVKANKEKKKRINIRKGPGTKYEVVAEAYYGVVFKTLKQQNGWAKIEHDSGTIGWVKRSLLWGF